MNIKEDLKNDVENVEKGLKDAAPLTLKIKELQDFLKDLQERLKPYVIEEIEKNGEALNLADYTISLFNPRTIYTYDHNEEYNRLESEKKAIEREQKKIKKQMEFAYLNGVSAINNDTGEIYEPAKYKSGGGVSYSIKKAKK